MLSTLDALSREALENTGTGCPSPAGGLHRNSTRVIQIATLLMIQYILVETYLVNTRGEEILLTCLLGIPSVSLAISIELVDQLITSSQTSDEAKVTHWGGRVGFVWRSRQVITLYCIFREVFQKKKKKNLKVQLTNLPGV